MEDRLKCQMSLVNYGQNQKLQL